MSLILQYSPYADKEAFAKRLAAGLKRTDISVAAEVESEFADDMIIIFEVDENGESVGNWGYEILLPMTAHNQYSIEYMGMPFSEKPFKIFGHTSDFDELLATIEALEFHKSGTSLN